MMRFGVKGGRVGRVSIVGSGNSIDGVGCVLDRKRGKRSRLTS